MNREFSVIEFGAEPNGEGFQTAAFQKALDSVFQAGGGKLIVPCGKYRLGGLRIRSNTTLYLCSGAELIASRDPEDYNILKDETLEPLPDYCKSDVLWTSAHTPNRDFGFLIAGSRWNNAIIRAICAENVEIIGEKGSVIDGCDPYDPIGEEHYRGPHGINMHYCKNVRFEGYTIKNTGDWAHCIQHSSDLSWKGVTVEGGHDGVHCRGCHDILIKDCEFYTGDDCVAGFGNYNVTVRNCVMNTACSAFRFGGADVLIEDCRIYGPAKFLFRGSLSKEDKISGARSSPDGRRNMLSMFTYYADRSVKILKQPENIVIRNCSVSNCDRFIHYNFSGNEVWQLAAPLGSLTIEGIRADGIRLPLTAYGSPDLPLRLTVRDCDIAFDGDGEQSSFMHAAHIGALRLEGLRITRNGNGAFIKCWSELPDVSIEDVTDNRDGELSVVAADEPFKCRSI